MQEITAERSTKEWILGCHESFHSRQFHLFDNFYHLDFALLWRNFLFSRVCRSWRKTFRLFFLVANKKIIENLHFWTINGITMSVTFSFRFDGRGKCIVSKECSGEFPREKCLLFSNSKFAIRRRKMKIKITLKNQTILFFPWNKSISK